MKRGVDDHPFTVAEAGSRLAAEGAVDLLTGRCGVKLKTSAVGRIQPGGTLADAVR
jgi:hypothetical protein